ncbi:MAG: hypothetical protein ACI4PO_08225 [Faecousia sp.]
MKKTLKSILSVGLLSVILVLAAGCAEKKTPYEVNDGENYTVSVKYDANGGIFTTNTSVIVDSYNITGMTPNANGQAEIALLPPDSPNRKNDAFTAIQNGYFLAGWYASRTETLNEAGETIYVYGDKWDFEKSRLTVDMDGTYSSSEPVLTLYAAWIPLFEVEFYSLDSGEYLDTFTFNPTTEGEISVPAWNTVSGKLDMYDFPKRSGYTFTGAYYDPAGKEPVEGVVNHPGVVDENNGMGKNTSMKLYLDWTEGEWYRIYTVEQFLDNASVSGSYEICADLDFAGKIWPTSLMYGNFSGTIRGNGHTLSNIELTQTNNSKVNAGLFGRLAETARLENLKLEQVTFTIQSGTRVAGTSYGLLAGSVSTGAVLENLQIHEGTLQIDSGCYFGVDDYSIGLLCGMGDASAVTDADITCAAVGENPDRVEITVSGNAVTLHFVE